MIHRVTGDQTSVANIFSDFSNLLNQLNSRNEVNFLLLKVIFLRPLLARAVQEREEM